MSSSSSLSPAWCASSCASSYSWVRAAGALVRALAVVTLGAALPACSVIYALNSDEENLACGPDNGAPRCLDGYTCVSADDGVERCVKAGFRQVGEPCRASAECADDAVCADAWATRCEDPVHRMNCALLDDDDSGLRCRARCKDTLPRCASDTRCFEDDGVEAPYCQQGVCAGDSDCVVGGAGGLCIEEAFNGGRSGLCSPQCAPLRCSDGGDDCPCRDDESCATPADETVSSRAVCTPTGAIGEGLTCDSANPCADGLTCAPLNTNTSVCLRWCAVSGGAPACSGGACNGVTGDPSLGVCQ
ncbi:MAG: hypothetical protein FJ137_08580 [Deltaproteobacteria bacterium]|nr:hypothetical protein [Deltaproteobacteria bacterium]